MSRKATDQKTEKRNVASTPAALRDDETEKALGTPTLGALVNIRFLCGLAAHSVAGSLCALPFLY